MTKLRDCGISDQTLNRELKTIDEFLHVSLDKKNRIGSIFSNTTNKLVNLYLAKKENIDIPSTLITPRKDSITEFHNLNSFRTISKSIYQGIVRIGKTEIEIYTNKVETSDIEKSEKKMFPTLFQQMLDKKYELRIFYFNDEFFASAIFSQNDAKTKVDFRHYNRNKPNRVVPYSLPEEIKDKLSALMKRIELQSGSIDMVVTNNNEYVFLEVNPVGQFNQVSKPCNYFLERIIASHFKKNNEGKNN